MAGSSIAIGRRRESERNLVFGEASGRVWSRKGGTKGFTTLPRAMPLICAIMDALTKGSPVSAVYLDLWFKAFDEMYLIIESPQERAFFSGFGGQRAETTWTSRMRLLAQHKFIEVRSGTRGEFHHVLLVNPYLVIQEIERSPAQTQIVGTELLAAYHQRLREVGAEELSVLTTPPLPPGVFPQVPPQPPVATRKRSHRRAPKRTMP